MQPIIVEEIPHSIKKYVKQIEKVTFPKQGCTSDVGILHTAKGRYVLKRAKGEKYRKWLFKEYYVLKNIKMLEKFRSPNAYEFVQTPEKSWLLLEFFEGKTVREYLEKEDNEKKREHIVYEMGRLLALIHGDYTIDNVLVHDCQIAAVIDWSGGALGDARYDIALAVRLEDGIFTGKERAAFFKGYGKGLSQGEFCYFAEGLYKFF
ncbi:aminoglycoside phosphotransferase family protein [Priestia aryabhattai]|nr:aminoglycoside phosphotransferase family protein [Priestia aryabhattai]